MTKDLSLWLTSEGLPQRKVRCHGCASLLLARGVVPPGCLELLDVLRRELGTIHLDRHFVHLAGKREGRFVVGIVDPGEGVGTDIETLLPLQDHGQSLGHFLGVDNLAPTDYRVITIPRETILSVFCQSARGTHDLVSLQAYGKVVKPINGPELTSGFGRRGNRPLFPRGGLLIGRDASQILLRETSPDGADSPCSSDSG